MNTHVTPLELVISTTPPVVTYTPSVTVDRPLEVPMISFTTSRPPIYNIDVEQADAALLVMPNGKTLLIDSGKNGHGQRVKTVMDRAGVTKIDVFVASHYHEDHYGGIDDLVDMGVPVLEAFDRGDKDFVSSDTKKQKTYKDYMRTVGEDARPLRRGDAISLDPLVTITCIGSGGVVIGEQR